MNEPFVGRAAHVAELRALQQRAAGGHGAIVLVHGEAGIGKTRLVDHALNAPLVLWARCRETGAPPLWPWIQIARAAERAGIGGLETLVRSVANETVAVAASSGHDRFARFDEITEALTSAAVRQPLVLVIDDLQWAEADTVELLTFLVGPIGHAPLLVVATVRAGEENDPLSRLGAAGADVHHLELTGLDTPELVELLGSTLGAPPDGELVEAVRERTGGNPLFVREVARLIRSSGAGRAALPDGVRAVLSRRLARLPHRSHEILGAAAVLGAEFDATVLAALVDAARSEAVDLLDPAIDAGLIAPLGDGRFRFAHALIGETALAQLPGPERRGLHARAAAVLTALSGVRAAAEIADHHASAENVDATREWSLVAARQATAAAMHAEAAAWYERALGSVAPTAAGVGDADRAELLIEFGTAAARIGRNDDSASAFAEASRLARSAGRADLLGRAALGMGTIGGSFEIRLLDPAHRALLAEALDRLGTEDSALRAWLLARLSVASGIGGDPGRVAALADEAVAMATRLGDDAALAHALAAFCDSRGGPAHHAVRAAAADEMLAAAVRAGDLELELLARRYQIVATMEAGNVSIAQRQIDALVRIADRLRQPQFRWFGRLMQAMSAHLRGDLDAAEALCRAASADGAAAGSANARMVIDGGLVGVLLRERGDIESFRRLFQDVIVDHHEASRGIDSTPLLLIDHDPDVEHVRRVVEQIPPEGLVSSDDAIFLLVTSLTLCGAAYVGDRALAQDHDARLAPFDDLFVLDGFAAVCYGPVSLFRGKAAAFLGDTDLARQHFGRALSRLVPLGAPLLEADVRHRLERLADPGRTADAAAPPSGATFCRDGEIWAVTFGSRGARFADAKGLRDLAALLARPGREVHVLDLVGVDAAEVGARGGAGLGPVLDAAARRGYESRIRDLSEDIEDAEAANDLGRAARLDDERAVLLGELSHALGLSGRDRRAGPDPTERARKAVGMRIRASIDRIERELPDLASHLRHSVRTGTFCVYAPERPVVWSVSGQQV